MTIVDGELDMKSRMSALILLVTCCLSPRGYSVDPAADIARRNAHDLFQMEKSTKRSIWFNKQQLLSICHFIEQQKKTNPGWSHAKFSHSKTNLPCDIERYPGLRAYIVRDTDQDHRVGRGCHKIVRRAIYYGPSVKLVADCDSDKTAKSEIKMLARLRGKRGIVPYLGSVKQKEDKRYSIFLEYFSGGSIRQRFFAGYKFSSEQAIKISKDLIQGLLTMHQQKLVHRDLHDGNALLRPLKNGLFEAALVDFGKTMKFDKVGSEIPQGARFRSPPEGLIVPFRKLDRFAVDVFALGCTLYQVVFGKQHPWVKVYNAYHVKDLSKHERYSRFKKIAAMYTEAKNFYLTPIFRKSQGGLKLRPIDRLKILVFRMIDYQPKRRPTIAQASAKMQQIAPKG
jgi:serine/threonine protein kinase